MVEGPWMAYQYPMSAPMNPMRKKDGVRSASAKSEIDPSMVSRRDRS